MRTIWPLHGMNCSNMQPCVIFDATPTVGSPFLVREFKVISQKNVTKIVQGINLAATKSQYVMVQYIYCCTL